MSKPKFKVLIVVALLTLIAGCAEKCNNAEGCDSCREFEIWLQDREGK